MPLKSRILQGSDRLENVLNGGPPLRPGSHDTDAVQRIQRALTTLVGRMPVSWPAAPGGNPDGIYGTETQRYVTIFQQRVFPDNWKEWDGIVGAKTLKEMDAALPPAKSPEPPPPPPPPAPPPAFIEKVYALLPRASTRVGKAIDILYRAGYAADHPSTTDYNKSSLALVNRCFKIFDVPDKENWHKDIGFVLRVYYAELDFLTEAAREHAYFIELPTLPSHPTFQMFVKGHGGWANKNKNDAVFVVKDKCERKSDNSLLDMMMHECAHFCGPKGDDNTGVGHQGPGSGYGDLALKLPNPKTLHNASNYAWFAGLAQTSQDTWLTGTYPS